jgi:hypothetical protein
MVDVGHYRQTYIGKPRVEVDNQRK